MADQIPAPLREIPHWVNWRWEQTTDKGGVVKRTKVPYQATYGERLASTTKAATWSDYGSALSHAERFDGVGFVLSETEIAAFDIDDCRDPETGAIRPWALRKVNEAGSYSEVTVSGTGIRIIGTGTGAKVHIKRPVIDGITCELYRRAERYIVMTGNRIDGTPAALANIDAVMDATAAELEREKQRRNGNGAGTGQHEPRERLTKAELRDLIKHGDKAGRYGGDRSAAVFAVIMALIGRGKSKEDIVDIITDPQNLISAHILDNGGAPAARRQIDRALAKRAETAGAPPPEITEDGVALAFLERYRGRLHYCHDSGTWYQFNGTTWRQNKTELAFHYARELTRFSQADPAFAVTAEHWDRDPWLLGTPDGIVNLHNGEMRPGRAEDGITKQTAVTPSNSADCPLWIDFLEQATGQDAELIRFLKQWCGYALTGITREHALVFMHGDGGTGKSVFLKTVAGILADYAVTAAITAFLASRNDQHPISIAMMRGARIVTASETQKGRAWNEALIKSLTGGQCRKPRCQIRTGARRMGAIGPR